MYKYLLSCYHNKSSSQIPLSGKYSILVLLSYMHEKQYSEHNQILLGAGAKWWYTQIAELIS